MGTSLWRLCQPGLCHCTATLLSPQESCPECPHLMEEPGGLFPSGLRFRQRRRPVAREVPQILLPGVAGEAARMCRGCSLSECLNHPPRAAPARRARQEPLPAPAPPAPPRPPRPRDAASTAGVTGIHPRGMGITVPCRMGGRDAVEGRRVRPGHRSATSPPSSGTSREFFPTSAGSCGRGSGESCGGSERPRLSPGPSGAGGCGTSPGPAFPHPPGHGLLVDLGQGTPDPPGGGEGEWDGSKGWERENSAQGTRVGAVPACWALLGTGIRAEAG